MFRVIKHFTDLQDGGRPYQVGDAFPREGLEVSKARLSELSSDNNRRGEPLIAAVKEKPKGKKK